GGSSRVMVKRASGGGSPAMVEAAVVDDLGDVLGRYCSTARQIRNRPRDSEHPVVAAGRQAEAPYGQPEQVARVTREGAPPPHLAGAHVGVDTGVGPGEAL